ncbi:metallophosphatase [Rhodomicrobium udaipurense JA643]|uniref:Metallophosphoesterase n=1 Tax=Rhodomicrobium udaipurense TaxID=1202716 RepID=A0A8I1GES2_9HYPH|nr:metallophosphoesterase [Rhodomicrobium udaipurense]KAI96327.1 metallophosphatase [Rhodomicrobium udaipurense JA643]MBJ7542476.1 metallophosphoesterase [Rhodomicrobium udaipurense]
MKIALCADLHFGSVPMGLEDALREAMEAERPDVIVVAGDLTLRARRREFEAAKTWLAALRTPALVLPGNHDLPYFNLLQRFADPFHRFHQATGTPHLMPVFEGGGGAVLGFNTARSWQPHLRWQDRAARRRDIAATEAEFAAMPPGVFKAVAAHHPFLRVPDEPRARPVRRAGDALRAFARCGVELLMSGHTHRSFAIEVQVSDRRLVALGAPTALSARMRGEANGFWIVEADAAAIACTLWLREVAAGRADRFSPSPTKFFARR